MNLAVPSRATLRRAARLGIAGTALLAAASGASAENGGLGGFLESIFGQPQQAATEPQAMPGYASLPAQHRFRAPRTRVGPLTVRLHQVKPRLLVAQVPTKPGRVSIYEDRTLRRGDAVMTAEGVRVFAGSNSWPYTAGDFVALQQARSLDRDTSKVLAQLDKVPRG